MAASEFFILTQHGDRLIYSDLRGEMPKGTPEMFHRAVQFWKDVNAPPVIDCDGIHFLYINRNPFRFVFSTKNNVSPTFYLELLARIAQVITESIGGLTENGIRKNSTLVYELISEIIDDGYVQSTSHEVLAQYVHTKPQNKAQDFINRMQQLAGQDLDIKQMAKAAMTKNELYVDVIENIHCVMNNRGGIVASSIEGMIRIHNKLEDHPLVTLKVNDRIVIGDREKEPEPGVLCLDDVNFHPCVDVEAFEKQRLLKFVGPEGEYNLMNFRSTRPFYPPITIHPQVEQVNEYKLDVIIRVDTHYARDVAADDVFVSFRTPPTTSSVRLELPQGSDGVTDYNDARKMAYWIINEPSGQEKFFCHAIITLTEPSCPGITRLLGPVNAKFIVRNYALSDLAVTQIHIEETRNDPDQQKSIHWLRYCVQTNSFTCRF